LNALATITWHFSSGNFDRYWFHDEKRIFRHDSLLGFPRICGILDIERRESARVVSGQHADRLLGFGVHEGRRHFSVIEKLESALAQRAAGDRLDGVRRAPVHLDVNDQFLAALRFVDADFAASHHGHADT
jgi:hypothetical protein